MTAATESKRPRGRVYADHPRLRGHGRGYRDGATSLLPDADATGPAPTTAPPAAPVTGREGSASPVMSGPVLRVLPLGAGLLLVGLGLGFLGLRLRRA